MALISFYKLKSL